MDDSKTQIFYVTFGQRSPFRNGWVEVEAETEELARRYVTDALGIEWSNLYSEKEFRKEDDRVAEMFNAGKIGETIK